MVGFLRYSHILQLSQLWELGRGGGSRVPLEVCWFACDRTSLVIPARARPFLKTSHRSNHGVGDPGGGNTGGPMGAALSMCRPDKRTLIQVVFLLVEFSRSDVLGQVWCSVRRPPVQHSCSLGSVRGGGGGLLQRCAPDLGNTTTLLKFDLYRGGLQRYAPDLEYNLFKGVFRDMYLIWETCMYMYMYMYHFVKMHLVLPRL